MKKSFLCVMLGLITFGFMASCSDDNNEDYQSTLPIFSDITFDYETIYTEQKVTATAVQATKGRLLDYTEYSWESDMPSDTTMTWMNGSIYDMNPVNPTCTFVTPNYPGSFTLTFKGKYRISGRASNGSNSGEIPNGLSTYQYSPLTGYVTVVKHFRVVRRP